MEVGGYFAQWGIYDRGYYLKHVDTTGTAAKLTFMNYAFGNIYKDPNGTYRCRVDVNQADPGAMDPSAPNAGLGGDAWADYQKGFTAAESVNGTSDPWGWPKWDDPRNGVSGPLKGNFNQLKQLKTKYPNLKVIISLGGWTWSKWFSAAAATDSLRKTLVSSCIDVYIDGNVPFDAGSNAGGPGVAAGIFDGIDIDWEFPGGGGQPYNLFSPSDKQNYTLLLAEFRRQLDAKTTQTGKKYFLTVAIGSGKDKIDNTEPGEYSKYLDWINIMSYDFHGGWEAQGPTDFQSNLYPDPASPNYKDPKTGLPGLGAEYNISRAVDNLLAAGVPPKKLLVGIPYYGRGWTGVTNTNNGLYQAATKPAKGSVEEGIEDYKVLKTRPGTVYTNPTTMQSWKFDGTTFWSYDTPANVQTKVDYVKSKGLRGVFSWELDGDDKSELTNIMNNVTK